MVFITNPAFGLHRLNINKVLLRAPVDPGSTKRRNITGILPCKQACCGKIKKNIYCGGEPLAQIDYSMNLA